MPDADLTGVGVLLVGEAPDLLTRATADIFTEAGAQVAISPNAVEVGALGSIDVCVCFARPGSGAPLLEMDADEWEQDLQRVLVGTHRLAMAAARIMAANSGGSIVLVGSLDAYHAYPGRSVAAVAMGGLLGLVRSMGIEFAASDIRVNLVLAGPIGDAHGAPPSDRDPTLVERNRMRSPLHRLGRPQEAAAAIRFVAGPDAGFMTGQTFRVDGGWASLNQTPEGMRFP